MKISVCIATYNGAAYILKQIESILVQLNIDDEVIVVDDCSADKTVTILESINDPRIKIFKNNSNRSHVYSFARAVSLAGNELIFMSDQDDIWIEGRVDIMKKRLTETGVMLITSNSIFVNINDEKIDYPIEGVHDKDSTSYYKNIFSIFMGKTNYYGCTMAFHKKLREVILPIPAYVESHDIWIAMAANLLKSNIHLDDFTLKRRIHGGNASVINRGLLAKIKSRLIFSRSLIDLFVKIKRSK